MICESAANVFQTRLRQKRKIHASLSERRIQLQQNFLLVKLSRVFSYQRFLRGDDSVLLLQQISIFSSGIRAKTTGRQHSFGTGNMLIRLMTANRPTLTRPGFYFILANFGLNDDSGAKKSNPFT